MKRVLGFILAVTSSNLYAKALNKNPPAKIPNKFPLAMADFLVKNNWKGGTTVSFVKFKCDRSNCTWKEVEIDDCVSNTTQLWVNFHPQMYMYSTSSESNDSPVEKMTVKSLSTDVFSVSLSTPQEVTSEYVVSLKCPEKGVFSGRGCEVKSVTGSMVDISAYRTTYDLITTTNLKDLKLGRCQ